MTDNRTNEPTEAQVEAAAKAMYELRAKIDDPFWEGGKLDYGIKQIYRQDARAALVEADAVVTEREWEYRGRLQSCGYVAEGYISAEHALNGLRAELEDHPFLVMDDTAIVERARVREWIPVEGEKS